MKKKIQEYQLIWDRENLLGTIKIRLSASRNIIRMMPETYEEFLAIATIIQHEKIAYYDSETQVISSHVDGFDDREEVES